MVDPSNEVRGPSPGLSGTIAHMEEEFKELEKMNRPRWPLAIGVVLLVGAAVGAYFWLGRSPESGRAVSSAPVEGVRIEISQPPNGSLLEGAPAAFVWESIAGRNDYLFSLMLESAPTPILERSSKTATLELSEEDAQRLGAGIYVWTVKARAKDGKILGTGTGRFRIR